MSFSVSSSSVNNKSSFFKPALSAFGTGTFTLVLMACSTSQAGTYQGAQTLSEQPVSGHYQSTIQTETDAGSVTIRQSSDKQSSYTINGTTYLWSDLSSEQQTKIAAIEEKMRISEDKLEQFEEAIEPLIEKIEAEADRIEEMVEAFEPELDGLDDLDNIENMTIKEITERVKVIEEKARAHAASIQVHEQALRIKESEIREAERKFLGQEREIEMELEKHVEAIVKVITEGE